MSSQLVDLHCHILPGIDDGAKNLDVSMSLIQKEMEDGVVGIVFTPHFHYERITLDAFVQQRKMAYRSVVAQLAERKLPLAVKLGAEVYFTTALASLDLSKLAFAGSRYILIEFPTSIHPGGIEDTLFAVQNRGFSHFGPCGALPLCYRGSYPAVPLGQLRRIGADQCFGFGAQWTYGQMAAQTAGLELSSSDVF